MYNFLKRTIDIFLSIVLLIVFSPIILITAFAIKLTSPGPILADTPKRVGQDGKQFHFYKFRSMVVNAHTLLKTDPKFRELYEEYKKGSYKLQNDPRWTSIGGFIRKYSIDEIPEFINVLIGEMSIVGPRPYYQDELEAQTKNYPNTKPLVKEVLTVKPGITGYWQVTGRSAVNFDKRIEMDANYARKKSIWFDIMILIKTPWAMLSGKGAV